MYIFDIDIERASLLKRALYSAGQTQTDAATQLFNGAVLEFMLSEGEKTIGYRDSKRQVREFTYKEEQDTAYEYALMKGEFTPNDVQLKAFVMGLSNTSIPEIAEEYQSLADSIGIPKSHEQFQFRHALKMADSLTGQRVLDDLMSYTSH